MPDVPCRCVEMGNVRDGCYENVWQKLIIKLVKCAFLVLIHNFLTHDDNDITFDLKLREDLFLFPYCRVN